MNPRLSAVIGRAPDWEHSLGVRTRVDRDAVTSARAAFERAPLPFRLFLVVGWVLLGLEGRAVSDDGHVLGWPVVRATRDVVVLQRHSRLGIDATLVFEATPGRLTVASGMVFGHRWARWLWAVVAPIHRLAVRYALAVAVRDAGRR